MLSIFMDIIGISSSVLFLLWISTLPKPYRNQRLLEHVRSGVPQGTFLGPLMFLIYINNITDNMDSATNMRLYTDDCLLNRIIRSSDDIDSLQNDLNSLTDWSSKWQMTFNTSKCKLLRITTKRNTIIHCYKMADDLLETVKHHPYLGVELSHIKWTNHIDNITAKVNQALWFIRRVLQRCPTSVK